MTLITKYAKYGAAVVASFAVAVALLVGSAPRTAHAATVSGVSFSAPIQAAGLTETWTVSFTSGTTQTTAGAGTITITFPSSFTVPSSISSVSTTGLAGAGTVTATGSSGVLTLSLGGTLQTPAAGAVTVTVPSVVNPTSTTALTASTTQSSTAGFAVAHSQADGTAAAAGTAPQVWNATVTKSPTTSVTADGASTVAVTFTSSNGATLGNTGSGGAVVFTATTDNGTFATTPTTTGTGWGTPTTVSTPVTSVTTNDVASMTAAATFVATVKAPTSAGTSTVILRATPATGGQAVIIGATSITWTTATAAPGAVSSVNISSPTSAFTVTATGTQAITAQIRDANGNAPIPGGTITVSVTLGTFAAGGTSITCTAGSQVCTGTVPTDGNITFTVQGASLSGSGTVTVSVGTASATRAFTVTGTAASIAVAMQRNGGTVTAPSMTAKGTLQNTSTTSTDRDEVLAVATAKDANGNVVSSGTVTFSITGPAGHGVTFSQVAAGGTLGSTMALPNANSDTNAGSCSGGGGGTTCTDNLGNIGSAGTTNNYAALAGIVVSSTTGEPTGTYTVTATIPTASGTATASTTFTMVKSGASISAPATASVAIGGTTKVDITLKDADGNPAPSGSIVTVNVSNANLIANNAATGKTGTTVDDLRTNDAGVATVTLIGVAGGSTQIVATFGVLTPALTSVTVAGAPTTTPTTPATGGAFSGGTIAASGVSIVSFTGTTAQLNTAGAASKLVSVTATVGGKMITFVVGAPDFVNAEFNAAFPNGLSGTLVIVKA